MSTIRNLLTDHIDIWTAADNAKKSGRGRSSNNAASVYGIKKLRELILELAVRGKLVPQDPNDEPASVLIKRAQVKEKNFASKRTKEPLVSISKEKQPFELPQGWEWVRLPEVSNYKVGKTPSTRNNAYWSTSDGYSWVSIADLNHDGHVLETSKQITDLAVAEVFRSPPAPAGTILMSFKLTLGKISILDKPAFHNEAIISIYPNQSVSRNYLFKILPSRAMAGDSKSAIKGNTLNSESIAALLIPLPPMAEQNRIVAKVDELIALCDQMEAQHINAAEAQQKLVSHLLETLTQSANSEEFCNNWQRIAAHFDTLFTTEASVDALKKTILQLAVMGKLVPQNPSEEPANVLLNRIQAERDKLIAKGKLKKERLVSLTNGEQLFDLPQGWRWTTLASICLINPRNDVEDNLQASFVPMNMIGVNFNSSHDQETRLWKEIKQGFTHFAEGDIGVAKITPCFENSKACVFSGLINGIGAGTTELHIVRPIKDTIAPRYVLAYLKSPQFLLVGETKMTGTAGQKRLPKYFVESSPFPLPPLAEQYRIIEKIDELMTLCEQLKARIVEANQLQQKLADTVVRQYAA